MKSTIGNMLKISLFGESHGDAIGIVIDGLTSGITIDEAFIKERMELRKPKGNISTKRKESDEVHIVSGVLNNKTCGSPLCIMIKNEAQHSKDYEKTKHLMRPSHADYTGYVKYHGFNDYRGGGHFSGRLTAPLVAAGALCLSMLNKKGIFIGSHIAQIRDVKDTCFSEDEDLCLQQIKHCNETYFATLNEEIKNKMKFVIEEAQSNLDSVGGVVETVVLGCPVGVGEPYFNSIESTLSHLIFSVGAVKGIEFGSGFNLATMMGSQSNDAMSYVNNRVQTMSNHNGGIQGGISNGMPIVIKTAVKPTPSIYKAQQTVNIQTKENCTLEIEGRHDPCIVHRIRVVLDSVVAIGLVDLLMERYGIDYFRENMND